MRHRNVIQILVFLMLVHVTSVENADAQRVIDFGPVEFSVLGESSRLLHEATGAEAHTSAEFFGVDDDPMTALHEAIHGVEAGNRNNFAARGVKQPSCEDAANAIIEAEASAPLPNGYKLRQAGTRRTTSNQNSETNNSASASSSSKASANSNKSTSVLTDDFIDTFVIAQSPHGNYYTADIWGTYVEIIIVYPVDPEAEYFSKDPDEDDIRNATMRLFDPSVNGRSWNETPQMFFQRPNRSTATLSCAPPETSERVTIGVLTSIDPNDKIGPVGVDEDRYIAGDGELDYTIRFENNSDASAPAQEVLVRDTLDATAFDLTSLQLHEITFGSSRVSVPRGKSSFSTRVALNDPLELLVDAHLVPETGVLTWRFITIDKNTGELPVNPLDGFLPPNVTSPEGEGSVSFSARLKDGVNDGAVIVNQAQIFFDLNEPINTPPWTNTVDLTGPSSSITGLASEQADSSFAISWDGSDAGAGISTYDVFVAVNGGQFKQWLTRTDLTETDFAGSDDSTYSFFSVAYDAAGNIESMKTTADATTAVQVGIDGGNDDAGIPLSLAMDTAYPNPSNGVATIRYGLPDTGPVSIFVYDLQGRTVLSVVNNVTRAAGWHSESMDVRNLASGVYISRLTAGNTQLVRKLTVVQ